MKERPPYGHRKVIVNKGDIYNHFTVIKEVRRQNSRRMVLCKCKCGEERIVRLEYLRSGHTKSCGCLKIEVSKTNNLRHGESHTRLHYIWTSMKARCTNPKVIGYKNYGGRGITYCDDWEVYEAFRDWALENGYTDELSIERINVDGNYEPQNCRWATRIEQARNKRNNVKYFYNGKNLTIKEWSEITGMSETGLLYRLSAGWSLEKTLTTPSNRKNKGEK